MFGSKVGFSGTADRTALFTVRTNPRWRPPPCLKNFKWRYLRNRSYDPFRVFCSRVGFSGTPDLWDGGSNGAIFDSNKFKMAAAAMLDNFEWPYLRATVHDLLTHSAHRAVIFAIAQLSCRDSDAFSSKIAYFSYAFLV